MKTRSGHIYTYVDPHTQGERRVKYYTTPSTTFDLRSSVEQAHEAAWLRDETGLGDAEGLEMHEDVLEKHLPLSPLPATPQPPPCCKHRDLTIYDTSPPSLLHDGPAYELGPLAVPPPIPMPLPTISLPPPSPNVFDHHNPSRKPRLSLEVPIADSASLLSPHSSPLAQSQGSSPPSSAQPTPSPPPSARLESPSVSPTLSDTSATSSTTPKRKRANLNEYQQARRKEKLRERAKYLSDLKIESGLHTTRESKFTNHPVTEDKIISSTVSREDVSRTAKSGGWLGTQMEHPKASLAKTKDEYLAEGVELVQWAGEETEFIVEGHADGNQPEDSRILIYLLGRPPGDESYLNAVRALGEELESLGGMLDFGGGDVIPRPHKGAEENRRGHHKIGIMGTSFGGGQTEPRVLKHGPENEAKLESWRRTSQPLKRITKWTEAAFASNAPLLHESYRATMDAICTTHDLPKNLRYSSFPAMSINFGPSAVCSVHKDQGNLADGFCWLLAGGDFDHKEGGHLYLPELNLLIEFPAGSSILFPSAVLAHGNAAIREDKGEIRWSITQFAAGGLFRWAEYGFHSWKAIEENHPEIAAQIKRDRLFLWRKRLQLLSTPASLPTDRAQMRARKNALFRAVLDERQLAREHAAAADKPGGESTWGGP